MWMSYVCVCLDCQVLHTCQLLKRKLQLAPDMHDWDRV
jgi:hypothetical protein